ncbi:MAG: hypothetical protein CVU56_02145 [Deltaproteobacteria bacterium HGW-Deltaproteobacteria-14]|jgi:hypothetical protein|nr:MAG: hypothetical protein CVU56_02145 [Deltaproteobacteria bacterium HGW-Deltaproteobacteria-14]
MDLRFYRRILDTCEPFLIARRSVQADLERAPLGLTIPEANVLDPQVVANGPFLKLVETLDDLTYGPVALRMPSWVFYDCALMTGAVFGFATRAERLPPWVRKTLMVPEGYAGLVPVSQFVAIPMAHRKAQLVFTLCSINQVAPGAAPEGLWRLTLAAGTEALQVEVMVATAQWRSAQLGLFTSLGPLKLLTAWTPAHDIRATATFYVHTDDDARARLVHGGGYGAPWADRYLDADSAEEMQALQAQIEDGLEVWVVGAPEIRGADTRVPLKHHVAGAPGPGPGAPEDAFVRRFQG